MREDRLFREHFRSVSIKSKPPNPWTSGFRAGWRDEGRPGRFSVLVYAAVAFCLTLCALAALPGGAPEPLQREIASWWQANQVHERVAEFLKQCAVWFPQGIM